MHRKRKNVSHRRCTHTALRMQPGDTCRAKGHARSHTAQPCNGRRTATNKSLMMVYRTNMRACSNRAGLGPDPQWAGPASPMPSMKRGSSRTVVHFSSWGKHHRRCRACTEGRTRASASWQNKGPNAREEHSACAGQCATANRGDRPCNVQLMLVAAAAAAPVPSKQLGSECNTCRVGQAGMNAQTSWARERRTRKARYNGNRTPNMSCTGTAKRRPSTGSSSTEAAACSGVHPSSLAPELGCRTASAPSSHLTVAHATQQRAPSHTRWARRLPTLLRRSAGCQSS